MPKYPAELLTLIAYLKKLPGVGGKTAERFAFQLLDWQPSHLQDFAIILATLKERIRNCPECSCLMDEKGCSFCQIDRRDPHTLCLVASAKDVFAIEETRAFHGLYHVLGGLLSPLDGRAPEHLQLDKLKKRITILPIRETIIALDSTVEGDATALYLREQLASWGIPATRLAFGLPIGSSLDFVDGGTLAKALTGRQSF